MRKYSISLCLIVKNEEENIKRCLESVYDFVDEVILGDTGSTDKTLTLARSFKKCKILDIEWANDFSQARNQVLRAATGEWILILDADEVIARKDLEQIDILRKQNKTEAYYFTVRNYINDSRRPNFVFSADSTEESKGLLGFIATQRISFFRNKQDIHYTGIIHETISPSLSRIGIRPMPVDIIVHHYGQLKLERDKKKREEKIKTYVALGEKQISLTPKDPKPYYDLALIYINEKADKDALEYLEQVIALKPDYWEARYNRAFIAFRMNNYLLAKEEFEEIVEKYPKKKNVLLNLGLISMKLNNPPDAITYLEQVLALDDKNILALYNFGIIQQSRGDFDGAIDKFRQVVEINPEFSLAYFAMGVVYFWRKEYDLAGQYFLKVKSNILEYFEARYNLGLVYQSKKEYKKAIQEYIKVLANNPEHLNANYNLAYSYQQLGEQRLALKFYQQTLSLNPAAAQEVNKRIREIERKQ